MNRSIHDHRPLFDPWIAWQELPNAVRQDALEALTAVCLEIVDSPNLEPEIDDSADH